MNAAITNTLDERLAELGGIAIGRIRAVPTPGTSTIDDLIHINHTRPQLCEMIDHTLVEKAAGFESSVVAVTIGAILSSFASPRRLGLVSGADGLFRLLPGTVRGPHVAFTSIAWLSSRRLLDEVYPAIVPDLAVELFSPGNTKAEMLRKRIEYFHSGVKLVWIVDCGNRSVAVYTSPCSVIELKETQTIDGGEVLPGFTALVADFFADLDLYQDPTA